MTSPDIIKAKIEAGEGDLRLSKQVIEKEIDDLEAKRNDLSNIVTAALAEVNNEKMRLAGEAQRLKSAQENLAIDQQIIVGQVHGMVDREQTLKEGQEALIKERKEFDNLIAVSKADIDEADAMKFRAESLLLNAENLEREAQEKTADLRAKANLMLKEAEEVRAQAEVDKAQAALERKEAQEIKLEYIKKLEASEKWADENSAVSDKLSIWEAALRNTDRKIQESKMKLAEAEKEFAHKIKGGN